MFLLLKLKLKHNRYLSFFFILLIVPCHVILTCYVFYLFSSVSNIFCQKTAEFCDCTECFLSTLKVVRFAKFTGGQQEFSFAKFVMEKSQVLESISFSCYKLGRAKIKNVKKKIFLVKRSFNIEFSDHLVT